MSEELLRRAHGDPSLRLVVETEYSSLSEKYRPKLRERIAAETFCRDDERARVLDLTTPLLHAAGRYVSISHCPRGGGFVLSAKPIGLDLEVPERVRPAVIARISKMAELAKAPSPAALWAAKEAAFKSLQHGDRRPDLASQIEIDGWKTSDSDSAFGTFNVKNLSDFSSRAALGCVIAEKDFILCTFALEP